MMKGLILLMRFIVKLCVTYVIPDFLTLFLYTMTKKIARLFDGKINTKIDLDSPKVATMDKIEAGKKKVYCRCWQSGTFPLCDGTHMEHNKETGDNVGPLIVSVEKAE